MNEHTGWLLDIYADTEGGLILWLLSDTGERLQLCMDFSVTFYAAGEFKHLRQAWKFLKDKGATLSRVTRRDLFTGELDVLGITVPTPTDTSKVFHALSRAFPFLDFYDADIPISLRFIAQTNVHMLGRCRIQLDGKTVTAIEALDSPWELDPAPIPLRILELIPDTDPTTQTPHKLNFSYGRSNFSLDLDPFRAFVVGLKSTFRRFDPDLILTDYGDTWLFPKLNDQNEVPFNPNRDISRKPLTRNANNYFAYGQVIYRGTQTHLFGRWHIDRQNALLFNEIGLQGALELARVSGLGVQETARKSPGSGITAMQMLTALRTGVLVPVVKQQAENKKKLTELIRADKGGLIYQPIIGEHKHVAQIDFASMYPSIMVNHNISPEKLGKEDTEAGLVPQTLRPLVEKRLALKKRLMELNPRDCRVKELKQRSNALKWLLVVCFGYLGYKNARFGKIESHEAVTAISRELMLQAKEISEDMGFTVLHMYVDSLFVQKEGLKEQKDFTPLLEAIHAQTKIPIVLDGLYQWLVFPPSKKDKRIPVPNRYFGIFEDGQIKVRGIAMRRHDTPLFVSKTQLGILKISARYINSAEKYARVQDYVQAQLRRLKVGKIPFTDLLVTKRISKELDSYKVPSPAAKAAIQLQTNGVTVRAGMRVKFWYVYGGVKVKGLEAKEIDVQRYSRILNQAVDELLIPQTQEDMFRKIYPDSLRV